MALYAGMDLHSRNTFLGILDHKLKRVFQKRIRNELPLILKSGGKPTISCGRFLNSRSA